VRKALGLARDGALYGWLPALLIVAWWELPKRSSLYFPPLWAIWDTFVKEWIGPQASKDIVPSMEHVAAGFALALGGGVLLALALSVVPGLHAMSLPVITFFRGLPSPALIPPLLLVFGLGAGFKIGIIALAAIWPVLLNAYDAFCSLDEVQQETAQSYRLSRWHRITRVVLPSASPQILAGARMALQVCLLVMVASEFLAANSGIGYAIYIAQVNFDTPGVWAGMLLLGVIGITLNALFVAAERRLLSWHFGMRVQEAQR
jgi:sulfonate transport system permease protein